MEMSHREPCSGFLLDSVFKTAVNDCVRESGSKESLEKTENTPN